LVVGAVVAAAVVEALAVVVVDHLHPRCAYLRIVHRCTHLRVRCAFMLRHSAAHSVASEARKHASLVVIPVVGPPVLRVAVVTKQPRAAKRADMHTSTQMSRLAAPARLPWHDDRHCEASSGATHDTVVGTAVVAPVVVCPLRVVPVAVAVVTAVDDVDLLVRGGRVVMSTGQPRCILRRIMHVLMQLSSFLVLPPAYVQNRLQCVASPKAARAQAGASVVETVDVAAVVVAVEVTQPRSIMRRVKHRSTHASFPGPVLCDLLQREMQCFESRARMQPAVVDAVVGAVVVTVVRKVTHPLSCRRAITHCEVHVSRVHAWRGQMLLHCATGPRFGLVRRACWHDARHTP